MNEKILIIDFGGQYNQLIARRVRECGVYCEIMPYTVTAEKIREFAPIGIIFTGGPESVYAEGSPKPCEDIFTMGVPILGICYGCQLLAQQLGGKVVSAAEGGISEYGRTVTFFDSLCPLFKGLPERSVTWMSHGDYISSVPDSFRLAAHSENCPCAAIYDEYRDFYGVQFHPEVNHTENGTSMIKNFVIEICGASGNWKMSGYKEACISEIRQKVGDKKALLALSGGVDSSVCAALMAEAIGKNLTCVFVDHGLMRKNESEEIEEAFKKWDINFIRVDAKKRFLSRLSGITEPEQKRKIIGEEFIRVFEEESKKIGTVDFLAQGTIYPDIIESGSGNAAVIKSHHNVGGLPDCVDFKEITEPLKMLFKDEVRQLGKELGLARQLVARQPFPGPGLAIRIIGEVTEEKLNILREADYIFRQELEKSGTPSNQYFAALTNMKSVGVMGDGRTYDYAIALRAVTTDDFMTAGWTRIPYEVLDIVSARIVNEVNGVNRVLYDITGKPPATVEFE